MWDWSRLRDWIEEEYGGSTGEGVAVGGCWWGR